MLDSIVASEGRTASTNARKRKLTFRYLGRTRRLLKRNGGSGPWYLRFKLGTRQIWRSTDTTEDAAAIAKAKKHLEAELNGEKDEARELQVRAGWGNLQKVADVYIEKFGTDARRKRTARNNVGALKKIVRVVLDKSLEEANTSVLTGELIRKFEAAMEKTIVRDKRKFMDHVSELRVRTSIESWVKQARSIFRKATFAWFEGATFPDLNEFRDQGVRAPERENPAKLDASVIESIIAAAPQLAKDNPACYIVFLLFSRLGLRNGEQKAMRMSWIERDAETGNGILRIIKRPAEQFKPKKSSRSIVVGKALLEEIDKHWEKSPDGDFIVPAPNKTDRAEIVDRLHSTWCGQWIKDHSKVSYELRRYAGSIVVRKFGIYAAKDFLGHASVTTTEGWYASDLDASKRVIDLDDFAV